MKTLIRTNNIVYAVGIILLGLGVALSIRASIGTSPFDALLVGLSKTVGLTVGSWEVLISLFLIVLNAAIVRRRPEFLGLLTAFVTGAAIDSWLFILGHSISSSFWIIRVLVFGLGMTLTGAGTALYLLSGYAASPVDRLTLIIKALTTTNLFVARTIIYVLFLILAFVFNGPIWIGTILTVCLGGLILNAFSKFFHTVLKKPQAAAESELPASPEERAIS